jgi:hypothetical protein
MNLYHYYIDLPFEIEKHESFDTVLHRMKHVHELEYDTSKMDEFLDSLDLYLDRCEAFYTNPSNKIPVHIDGTCMVKINKTWGPEGGTTRWFKPSEYIPYDSFGNHADAERVYGKEIMIGIEKEEEMVYEANTNRTSLLNVGEFHGTYNPSETEGRWTICFQMKRKDNKEFITWEEAVTKYFKDYIVGER